MLTRLKLTAGYFLSIIVDGGQSWNVNDLETSEIIEAFYQGVAKAENQQLDCKQRR